MEEHLDHVEEIYFAGGEPLITEEHYRILKELDRRGRHGVRLIYNTNFSQMKYKDLDVMKIWPKFRRVSVGASLDAPHARGEYMRKGQNWQQTVDNRERMMEVCPDTSFFVSCTVSMMNVWILPDFIEEWLDLGYLDNENHAAFHINPLIGPARLRTQVLPIHLKDEVAEKIRKTIKRLEGEKGNWDFLINALRGTIYLMYEEDHTELLPELLDYMLKLDKIRGEDFFEVFPEWESLKDYR